MIDLDAWEKEAKESAAYNLSQSRIAFRDHRILALISSIRAHEKAVEHQHKVAFKFASMLTMKNEMMSDVVCEIAEKTNVDRLWCIEQLSKAIEIGNNERYNPV